MIELVVDNRVRVLAEPHVRSALVDVIAEHEHENPDYKKAKHFRIYRKPPRTIATWQEEGVAYTFPRGSLPRVRAALDAAGQVSVRDLRTLGDPTLGDVPPHTPPSGALWPHQAEFVEQALRKQNALMRAAAGGGKTTAALSFAARVNLPTLVVVHNANLFEQWISRCVAELGVPRTWVGQIRGAQRRLGPITVGMQQSLYGCAHEVAPAFGCVVVDEVHRAASRTFLEVVDAMTAKYRLGVSDDERRSDGKEFLIYDMFGGVVAEASHDQLVEAGHVMDVRVRVVPTDFSADWYRDLEDRNKVKAYGKLLEMIAADPGRNAIAMKEVPLALAFGHQVILFTHRVDHALELDRRINAGLARSGFVVGEQPAESQATLERFRDGRVSVVVGTYQSLGTGVDMPRVSRGVFCSPIANNDKGKSQFKQFRGRFARRAPGKADPEIVYLWDVHVFGARPLRHLCRWANDVRVEWRGELVPGRQVLKEIEE